jgi:hypothetical protein
MGMNDQRVARALRNRSSSKTLKKGELLFDVNDPDQVQSTVGKNFKKVHLIECS